MKDLILSIDQGTTNSKALLINTFGKIVSKGACPTKTEYPQSGWVEQDGKDIWFAALKAIDECVKDVDVNRIAAIGISNQRESVLGWDNNGKPLSPLITWQCGRSADVCEEVSKQGKAKIVLEKTGLPINTMFPASKITWMLRNINAVKSARNDGNLKVGTVDSWLVGSLTGFENHFCDASNASRTQLFNLKTLEWDKELCEIYDVPENILPKVKSSNSVFGYTKGVSILPDGIPVCGVVGDSHAALFGHGARVPGSMKITYGTGSSLMTPLNDFIVPEKGLATTIAWQVDGKVTYAFEGNIVVCASSIPWAMKWLNVDKLETLIDMAKQASEENQVVFVPALVGLGAPHWRSDVEGLIDGLTFNTGKNEIALALFESKIFQAYDVFSAMQQQAPKRIESVYADGGPSRDSWLMQKQANLINTNLYQCQAPEVSALGAAFMAGLAVGIWKNIGELDNVEQQRTIIKPKRDDVAVQKRIGKWQRAVERVLM